MVKHRAGSLYQRSVGAFNHRVKSRRIGGRQSVLDVHFTTEIIELRVAKLDRGAGAERWEGRSVVILGLHSSAELRAVVTSKFLNDVALGAINVDEHAKAGYDFAGLLRLEHEAVHHSTQMIDAYERVLVTSDDAFRELSDEIDGHSLTDAAGAILETTGCGNVGLAISQPHAGRARAII